MNVNQSPIATLPQAGLSDLQHKWGWIVGLGIALMFAGLFAISSAFITTLFSVALLGWLMIVSGISVCINAFQCRQWGGVFLDLIAGVLYIAAGFLIVGNPGAAAVAFTLVIAFFLLFGGLMRIVASIALRFPNYGLLLLHGIVSFLLGISIWQKWPFSGLWVIGLFVGIEILFNGTTLLALGLSVRNLQGNDAATSNLTGIEKEPAKS